MVHRSAPLRLCPLTLCPDIPKALRPYSATKQLLVILQTLPRGQSFLHLLRKLLVNGYVLHLRTMQIVYSLHWHPEARARTQGPLLMQLMFSKTPQLSFLLSHQKLQIVVPQYVRLLHGERHPLVLWVSLVARRVRLAIHQVRLFGHLVCHCLHRRLVRRHHLLVLKV